MTAAVYARQGPALAVETVAAWLLGVLWILPLVYAIWTAFHPPAFSTRFALDAPLTLDNFVKAWHAAPFARYFANTVILVTMVLVAQLVLVTLAAYAFARFDFPGRNIAFALVLVQLMIMPDVLLVENYRTMTAMGIKDTRRIYRAADLAPGRSIVFAATGVTEGALMKSVRFFGDGIRTESLVMQTDPRQVRFVDSIHVDDRGDVEVRF